MKYLLIVSGIVEFKDSGDEPIRQLLLSNEPIATRKGLAIQELEEQAGDIKVEMQELPD